MKKLFLIALLVWPLLAQDSVQIIRRRAAAGGGITFIQERETAYFTTTPKTTASFDVQSGDTLVAYAFDGNSSGAQTLSVSGGGLTWTLRAQVIVSSRCGLGLWTAPATSTTSMTVAFANTGGDEFGGNVLTFRGANGIGVAGSSENTTGAADLDITTTVSSSVVVVGSCDWNAVDGASRTWQTTVGALTEQTYDFNSSIATVYGGYYANTGTAGTKSVGLTAPTGQRYSIGAVELTP